MQEDRHGEGASGSDGTLDEIPLAYVLDHARRHGGLGFARAAVRTFLIERESDRRGLTADEEAVQQAADRYRRERGLESAARTTEWLAQRGMTVEAFEAQIRAEVVARLVRDDVTRGHVEALIQTSPASAETATVARIRHRDRGVVEEIAAIEADGERDFYSLARQCSEDDETAAAGGHLGTVPLSELPAPIHDEIRRSAPGTVVGPVETAGGWELFLVEAFEPADSVTGRERAANVLFERWVDEQLAGVRVESLGPVSPAGG